MVETCETHVCELGPWLPVAAVGVGCGVAGVALLSWKLRSRGRSCHDDVGTGASRECANDAIVVGLEGLIGNTPLVEIRSLSLLTGCRILAKAEHLNPGGSSKDR